MVAGLKPDGGPLNMFGDFMIRALCYLLLFDLFWILIGWLLSRSKNFHRVGVRVISDSLLGFWLPPYFCRCRCDGSCKIWTCPKYQKDPGKFEVTDK